MNTPFQNMHDGDMNFVKVPDIVMCGICRSKNVPLAEGIHYCGFCGKGHEIEKVDGHFIIHPYPREREVEG